MKTNAETRSNKSQTAPCNIDSVVKSFFRIFKDCLGITGLRLIWKLLLWHDLQVSACIGYEKYWKWVRYKNFIP